MKSGRKILVNRGVVKRVKRMGKIVKFNPDKKVEPTISFRDEKGGFDYYNAEDSKKRIEELSKSLPPWGPEPTEDELEEYHEEEIDRTIDWLDKNEPGVKHTAEDAEKEIERHFDEVVQEIEEKNKELNIFEKKGFDIFSKVVNKIKEDPSLVELRPIVKEGKIDFDELRSAASNHMVDDNPDKFGLDKNEADKFRSFMQNESTKKHIKGKIEDELNDA